MFFALAVGVVMIGATGWACSSKPPVLGDLDGARADVFSRGDGTFAPQPDASADAAEDGGLAFVTEYEAVCPATSSGLWSYHDFQTKTPKDSAIVFSAQTAATKVALDTATSVQLARVTGPDITSWTGVDVDGKLTAAGQKSLRFLRVTVVLQPATDATAPTLVASRQQYDCIQNM
jgi:hypothetical protein